MAEEHKLKVKWEADTKEFTKSVESMQTTVGKFEKKLQDAFGEIGKKFGDLVGIADSSGDDLSDAFSESVSSLNETGDSVDDLKDKLGELSNTKIDTGAIDNVEKSVDELGDTITDSDSSLGELQDTVNKMSEGNIPKIEDSLDGVEDSSDGAKKSTEGLDDTLKGIGKGNNLPRVEDDMKGVNQESGRTEKGVDDLDESLKNTGKNSNLPEVEDDLDGIGDKASEATGILEEMAGVLAGMAGISGIGDALEKGANRAELEYDLMLSLENKLGRDLKESEYRELTKRFNSISNTLGSDDEALELIRTITLQSNYEHDDDFIGKSGWEAEIASNLARTYGLDAYQVYRYAVTVGAVWDMDTDKVMANFGEIYSKGFQGELDEIAEYTTAWDNAGMSKDHQFGVLMGIAESDVHLPDRLMDAYKIMGESLIGLPTSLEDMSDVQIEDLDSTGISAKQWIKWGNAIKTGGKTGEKAWDDMRDTITSIQDPIKRTQILQSMFGGGFEDTGKFLLESWNTSKGVVMDTNQAMENTTKAVNNLNSEPWKEFRDHLANIAQIIEKSLEPHLEKVNRMLSWLVENPEVIKAFTDLAVALSLLSTVIGGLSGLKILYRMADFLSNGKLGEGIGKLFKLFKDGKVVEGIGKIGGALKGLFTGGSLAKLGVLVGKFLLIVGAIAAVGAVLYVLWDLKDLLVPLAKNFSMIINLKLIEFFLGLADAIDRFGGAVNTLITGVGELVSKVPEGLFRLAIGIVESIQGLIMGVFGIIRGAVEGIILFIYEKIEQFLGFLGIDVPESLTQFKDGVVSAFDEMELGITEPFERVTGWLGEKSEETRDKVTGFFGDIGDKAEEGIGKASEGIRTGASKWAGYIEEAHDKNLEATYGKYHIYKKQGKDTGLEYSSGIKSAEGYVKGAMADSVDGALIETSKQKQNFYTQGQNIMANISSGMRSNEGSILNAMGGVLQRVRNMLPFSPPKDKTSPLADIHKNGIGTQIAKGIASGEGEVNSAMSNLLDFSRTRVNFPELMGEIDRGRATLAQEIKGNIRTNVGMKYEGEMSTEPIVVNVNNKFEINGREYDNLVTDGMERADKLRRKGRM